MSNNKILICVYGNNTFHLMYNFCARLIKMCAYENQLQYDICIAVNGLDTGYNSVLNLNRVVPSKYTNKPNIFITGFEENYNICDFFIKSFLENSKFNINDYKYVWCVNGASAFCSINRSKTNVLLNVANMELEDEFDCFNINEYVNNTFVKSQMNVNSAENIVVFQNMLAKYIFKPQAFNKVLRDIVSVFKNMKGTVKIYKNKKIPNTEFDRNIIPDIIGVLKTIKYKNIANTNSATNFYSEICPNPYDLTNTFFRLSIVLNANYNNDPHAFEKIFKCIYSGEKFAMPLETMYNLSYMIYTFINNGIVLNNSLRATSNVTLDYIQLYGDIINIRINDDNVKKYWFTILLNLETETFGLMMPCVGEEQEPELFYEKE